MTTLCDPLSHEMDIDSYDIPEWDGRCQKCGADLTYKWSYNKDQVDKSKHYFNLDWQNLDIGTTLDYSVDNVFAVLSDVDNDPELSKGVFIIPYNSVTIVALKDGVQTTTTEILNPTYEKLKSSSNTFGSADGLLMATTDDQFNKAWQKSVVNDSWLKKTYSGVWNAINIKQVQDKFSKSTPRKV